MRFARSLLRPLVVLTASTVYSQAFVPDHVRTPGVIDPGIKQENIAESICFPSYAFPKMMRCRIALAGLLASSIAWA